MYLKLMTRIYEDLCIVNINRYHMSFSIHERYMILLKSNYWRNIL